MGPSLPFPNIPSPIDSSFPRSSPETETNPFFEIHVTVYRSQMNRRVRPFFRTRRGMFLRRTPQPQDTLIPAHDFNRRIFSASANVSWKWGSIQTTGFPLSFSSSCSISYHK